MAPVVLSPEKTGKLPGSDSREEPRMPQTTPHLVATGRSGPVPSGLPRFSTGREAALEMRPDQPVYCFRPEVLAADAAAFLKAFPGKTAYAVKTNGEPMVLDVLARAGINAFDVASPAEFAAARAAAPGAELFYMHPVKA